MILTKDSAVLHDQIAHNFTNNTDPLSSEKPRVAKDTRCVRVPFALDWPVPSITIFRFGGSQPPCGRVGSFLCGMGLVTDQTVRHILSDQ